ncbi:MAG: hypothetical protein H8E32_01905 [Nitrospinae bacterium]|nr:hypothetical protein [Nitrospinota bacterium]
MDFSIVPVSKVFKTYQGQARIADLNKKSSVKRVQGQRDQVTISSAARQALQKNPNGDSPQPVAKDAAPAAEVSKQAPVASGDFVPGI